MAKEPGKAQAEASVTLGIKGSNITVAIDDVDGEYDAAGFFKVLNELNAVAEMIQRDAPLPEVRL